MCDVQLYLAPFSSLRDMALTGDVSVRLLHCSKPAEFNKLNIPSSPEMKDDANNVYALYVCPPEISGTLHQKKRHRAIKQFKSRFWSLKKNELSVFTNDKMTELSFMISVKIITAVHAVRSDRLDVPKKLLSTAFEVVTPDQTFLIATESRSEMFAWIEDLERSRKIYADNPSFWAKRKEHKIADEVEEEKPEHEPAVPAIAVTKVSTLDAMGLDANFSEPEMIQAPVEEPDVDLTEELPVIEDDDNNKYPKSEVQVVEAMARIINHIITLKSPSWTSLLPPGMLPINPWSRLFTKSVMEGVLICYILNMLYPGTLDERVIRGIEDVTSESRGVPAKERKDNISLSISAAFTIGADTTSIDAVLVSNGVLSAIHRMRMLVWEVICLSQLEVVVSVCTREPTLLPMLANPGEDKDTLALDAEEVVRRWFIKTVPGANVTTYTSELSDGKWYESAIVFIERAMERGGASDDVGGIDGMLTRALDIGARPFHTVESVADGNSEINRAFIVELFIVGMYCMMMVVMT